MFVLLVSLVLIDIFTFLLHFADESVFDFLTFCGVVVLGLRVWLPSLLTSPTFNRVFSSVVVVVVAVLVGFHCCLLFLFASGYTLSLLMFLALCSVSFDVSVKFAARCSGLRWFWSRRLVSLFVWVVSASPFCCVTISILSVKISNLVNLTFSVEFRPGSWLSYCSSTAVICFGHAVLGSGLGSSCRWLLVNVVGWGCGCKAGCMFVSLLIWRWFHTYTSEIWAIRFYCLEPSIYAVIASAAL